MSLHRSTNQRTAYGIGLTADALSFRAAFGVTEAAQAPLARRERSEASGDGTARYSRLEAL
jgi:hypothetical protein